MTTLPGSGWTRDKEILILDLYFVSGGRTLWANDPEVINLACAIGMQPADVNRRIRNFVACDPDNPSKGLANVAQSTKSLWDEFARDQPRLRQVARALRIKYGHDADGWLQPTASDIRRLLDSIFRENDG